MSDYYALLGVSRDATADEIAIAYRQLVRQRHQNLGSEANLNELSQAYRTLSSLERRREYNRTQQMLSGKFVQTNAAEPSAAEQSYFAGLEAMEKQNYQAALECFAKAIDLDPGQSHFHSQLGLALGMFRDRLAEAEQYCKSAIELDPDNPELFYNLGFLYQRHNLNDAAQEAFIQAQNAMAQRQARLEASPPAMIEAAWREGQPAAVYSGMPRAAGSVAADAPAGDLLQELESLESSLALSEASPAGGPAVDSPPAAASTDDLLKELESIEAQVIQAENGAAIPISREAVAAPAPQPDLSMAEAIEEVSRLVTADDLLKELEEMEAQVNQAAAEEPVNEADTQVAQAFAAAGTAAAAPPPPPDIFQETQAADDAAVIVEQADMLLKEFGTGPEPLPVEPIQPAAPESAPEPAPQAEPPLQLETAAIEQPAATPPPAPPEPETEPALNPVLSREDEHGQPVDPEVQQKVKQLEALESEMEEELQRLRTQRQKLLKQKK